VNCLMVIKFRNAVLVVLITLLFFACARDTRPRMEFAMGTINAVNLFESGNNQLYSLIFSRIREIDRTMSVSGAELPDGDTTNAMQADSLYSGVAAINRLAGVAPVKVSDDLLKVLERALYYAELSDGAFDPTIGPLVALWGIGTDSQRLPGEDEIAAALELVNWHDLLVYRQAGTVFLRREGMALDLGAIAKGYAGDEAVRIAKEGKVQRAIVDLGGNIVVLGWRGKQGKEPLPWRVGVQNPLSERGAHIGVLPVHDTSIVTSGVYERYFELDGKRYHHLFSTTDGYPVENGLLSVTIITERSIEADALSTVVFTLGFERGRAFIESIPGAEAIFVFDDCSVRITSGLVGVFSLTDDAFTVLD
jgi:thiamine biosynthesis lipoprotein